MDSKGEQNPINETSVLFAKVGHRIAIATESGSVSTYSQDGIKLWESQCEGMLERITAIGWNGNS